MQPELSRIEYWGTTAEWVGRESTSTDNHLARVSFTLLHQKPKPPGPRLLPIPAAVAAAGTATVSPLDALYRRLSAALLESPEQAPAEPTEAIRLAANSRGYEDRSSADVPAALQRASSLEGAVSRAGYLHTSSMRASLVTRSLSNGSGASAQSSRVATVPPRVAASDDDDSSGGPDGAVSAGGCSRSTSQEDRVGAAIAVPVHGRAVALRHARQACRAHAQLSEMGLDDIVDMVWRTGAQGVESGLVRETSTDAGCAQLRCPPDGEAWCVELTSDEGWRWFRRWRGMP